MKKHIVLIPVILANGHYAFAGGTPPPSCLDDPNAPKSAPSERFIIHEDGTTTDKLTGLMWQRCVEGKDYEQSCLSVVDDYDCSEGYGGYYDYGDGMSGICVSWEQAFDYVETLNQANSDSGEGYSDWRLPNIRELQSIVESSCTNPTYNTDVFPLNNTDIPSQYADPGVYSSSSSLDYGVLSYEHTNGRVMETTPDTILNIRLVRDIPEDPDPIDEL